MQLSKRMSKQRNSCFGVARASAIRRRWPHAWPGELRESLLLLLFAVLVAGCSENPTDLQVHQITKPGFASVNSWLIETDDGVVVIDAQRVLSAGQLVVDAIDATNKPLLAIIITHPHPDHFGGLAAILDAFPETAVYASRATTAIIATDSNGFQKATRAAVPNDSPDVYPAPTHTFEDGEVLRFGALEFVVHEIGPGEAETMSMLYAPNQNLLFVGDLVAHQMNGFVLEGRSRLWLDQIDIVRERYGESAPFVYPGHGPAGEFDLLLSTQKRWLTDLRTAVAAELTNGELTEHGAQEALATLQDKYGNDPSVAEIPQLMELNIIAVSEELTNDD